MYDRQGECFPESTVVDKWLTFSQLVQLSHPQSESELYHVSWWFNLNSGYWPDWPSVGYNLWCFWLMSSFIINLSKSIVQMHYLFNTQIIWESLLPWNTWISFAVLPKFEVKVELPPYLLERQKALHGKVTVRCVNNRLRGKHVIAINICYWPSWFVHPEKVLNFSNRLEKSFEFGQGPWKVLDFSIRSWKVLEIFFTCLYMPDTHFL